MSRSDEPSRVPSRVAGPGGARSGAARQDGARVSPTECPVGIRSEANARTWMSGPGHVRSETVAPRMAGANRTLLQGSSPSLSSAPASLSDPARAFLAPAFTRCEAPPALRSGSPMALATLAVTKVARAGRAATPGSSCAPGRGTREHNGANEVFKQASVNLGKRGTREQERVTENAQPQLESLGTSEGIQGQLLRRGQYIDFPDHDAVAGRYAGHYCAVGTIGAWWKSIYCPLNGGRCQ